MKAFALRAVQAGAILVVLAAAPLNVFDAVLLLAVPSFLFWSAAACCRLSEVDQSGRRPAAVHAGRPSPGVAPARSTPPRSLRPWIGPHEEYERILYTR